MIYTKRSTVMGAKSRPLLAFAVVVWLVIIGHMMLASVRGPLPDLPPSLKQLLCQAPPVTYPAPQTAPEWKRPLTLTAHATLQQDTVKLVLFTTGVDTQQFGRAFSSVGCLVGSHALPAIALQPAMVTCEIQRELLSVGMPLTVVIEHDGELTKALKAENQTLGGEEFSFQDGDVIPLPETPRELQEKAGTVATIRTLVKWHDGYLDKPTGVRHELCLMTAMRQYPFLLKDWIAFYRRLGVDKVYIYENWATEDLDKLVGSDFVEVVRWPWVRSQMQSNNHFLLSSKTRCKHVAFFDADEFAMVGGPIEDNMLKKYIRLRSSEGHTQIITHFLMMLNNGYVRRPKGPLPSLYTRREKDQVVKQGKPIIETDAGWNFHKIHMVEKSRTSRGTNYWNMTMELEPRTIKHNAMLVHYTKRSWEEYVLKNKVGGASVMTKGRPKVVLDIEQPDEEYMGLGKSVEFGNFKERWKKIMQVWDDGAMTLISAANEIECRQKWCPKCIFGRVGKEECYSKKQEN